MTKKKEVIAIRNPYDAVKVFKKWYKAKQEHFLAITLNGAHEVIKVHVITVGLVNRTLTHPRECYYPVIKDLASAVIFAHNHPSGSVLPSKEDVDCFRHLGMAGQILGINVLDILIFNRDGQYYSSREMGDFPEGYTTEYLEKYVADIPKTSITNVLKTDL